MTTIHGHNGETIQFSFSSTIHETEEGTYVIQMPLVVCDNRKIADAMQRNIGSFISDLSKQMLSDDR